MALHRSERRPSARPAGGPAQKRRRPEDSGSALLVTGPAEDPGPWPGLILEGRKDQATGWSALVVYTITAETVTTAVQTWVQHIHLRPV